MVIINGRVFTGNNVTKFDERKVVDCSNVDKITIDSTVCDVDVSASNSSKAEAHFYGGATVDGDVNFDVRVVNRELMITLRLTGNCYRGNLILDVTIPQRTFKVITAKSLSADITLNAGVATDYLKVKTKSEGPQQQAPGTLHRASNTQSGTVSGWHSSCQTL